MDFGSFHPNIFCKNPQYKNSIMKRTVMFTMLLGMTITLVSCYKDINVPPIDMGDPPPKQVSFKTELAPIFNANCATSGCHASGGHKPYMETAVSYQQIVGGGFVNIDFPKESILYKQINGDMQEHIPAATDRQKVYDWIRNGAPNN
jgi:hypothetical protein